MKLECLTTGSPGCPLLRLYDFTPAVADRLRMAVAALASGATERIGLDRLPFVEPVGGCRLVLVSRYWDQAVIRRGGPAEFERGFTPGTWDRVAGLIEPFAVGTMGFQWLAGARGEAPWPLSSRVAW